MTTHEASRKLEWPHSTVRRWAKFLGLGRGRGYVTDLSDDDLATLIIRRREFQERSCEARSERMKGNKLQGLKSRAQHIRASEAMVAARRRRCEGRLEFVNHDGERFYSILPTHCDDPQLRWSARNGGPLMPVMQWHAIMVYE